MPYTKSGKASFLNSYEENGFSLDAGSDASDPGEYSLSTYTRLKDVARFVKIDSRYQPPFGLAKGKTAIECGPCCATKEWKIIIVLLMLTGGFMKVQNRGLILI